ncbi:hypothetical protein MKW94_020128, partial [Papaver nudicaule]|nr:hypothetical protein [Papaver nudicaule]MCL7040823.1 hypothetical protein [Papaver nudicaule]
MALRATGRLLSERLSRGVSRNFSAQAAESPKIYRKDYEARLEKLLKTEAGIIKSGDPQLIKEFKELKNIAQYNK